MSLADYAQVRLEALQIAQKEGLFGDDLAERAEYLADFIERGKEIADSTKREREAKRLAERNAARVSREGLPDIVGLDWKDGDDIPKGTRLAFPSWVPDGWAFIERKGYLSIGEKR